MKSRIRLLTIFFVLVMLIALGTPPYMVLLKRGVAELNAAVVIMMVLFLLLFAGGLLAVIWLTLIVKIDNDNKQITFIYPFRLKTTTLKFDEILGFRFKYLKAVRIDYKALQIKTKTGATFLFSDFETANLRDFEDQFLLHFELRKDRNFAELSGQTKEEEINESRLFDYEQAKTIRLLLFILIGFCVFMIGVVGKKSIDNENGLTPSVTTTVVLTLLMSVSGGKSLAFRRRL